MLISPANEQFSQISTATQWAFATSRFALLKGRIDKHRKSEAKADNTFHCHTVNEPDVDCTWKAVAALGMSTWGCKEVQRPDLGLW
jgi:hypothetical protein